jgi:hypothetical protein
MENKLIDLAKGAGAAFETRAAVPNVQEKREVYTRK